MKKVLQIGTILSPLTSEFPKSIELISVIFSYVSNTTHFVKKEVHVMVDYFAQKLVGSNF